MFEQESNDLNEAVSAIENAFNRKGKYLQDGVPRYTAHAVRLEEETGLSGIAGRYRFPENREPAFAEYEYRKRFLKYSLAESLLTAEDPLKRRAAEKISRQTPQALEEVKQEIEKLTVLNPDLKRLNYDRRDFIESYRALIGVTSQYNVDDINAYLHSIRTGQKDEEANARIERLKDRGCRFGWVPAVKTLDRIERGLDEREKTMLPVMRAARKKSR
ncbi:MAG: hypothetical protein ACI4PW_03790 [Alphaproteobacteria bacterium]|jgi:hypothetical protein